MYVGLFDGMGGDAENEASEGMTKIQCELLHMFGAVMAASKVSTTLCEEDSAWNLICRIFMKLSNLSTPFVHVVHEALAHVLGLHQIKICHPIKLIYHLLFSLCYYVLFCCESRT